MPRIETYPLDYNITINDYVIGTDGDSLNATKNYKVLTFLDYLGTMYNLNSTDLLFTYNNVPSSSVGQGQVSTNNFADSTILMSGVNNIYVSKITAFGQLVDDIINTIGTEGITIMFTDMGNRNNLGIFTVASTADVDANTINMTVSSTTAVGSIVAGRVMGIRIGIGGGGGAISDVVYGAGWNADTTNGASKNVLYDKIETLVTLNTIQTITGRKEFSGGGANALEQGITINEGLIIGGNTITNGWIGFAPSGGSFDTTFNPSSYQGTNKQYRIGINGGDWILTGTDNETSTQVPYTRLVQNYTASRTQTWQDKNGTIAHLADIPTISDVAYDATTWNTNLDGASKNAIRDQFEALRSPSFTHVQTDQQCGANTIDELLTYTIAANTLVDGGLITFEATFTINGSVSTDQLGLIIDGGSLQGITNTGGGITRVYMRGFAVRNGSTLECTATLIFNGSSSPVDLSFNKTGLTFTSDIDFSISGGGTTGVGIGDITLNNGLIKLN